MKGLNQSKDIDPWLKRFRELDADGSGALDEDVCICLRPNGFATNFDNCLTLRT